MNKKLSKVELKIIQLTDEKDYSLHQCPTHGVHSHSRHIEYEGCFHYKVKYPEVTKESLLK